jgi:L-aminopeptidase/D-esterase-like protein
MNDGDRTGTIVDVPGILVGSVEDRIAVTGCTVLIFPERAVCGVDVRGGSTGTREIALLSPSAANESVDAILLTGGSAFGLDAAGGVVEYLQQQERGVRVGKWIVPIVPAAVLFDLNIGDGSIRPDREMGYLAASLADASPVREGNYGAGCGATVGKLGGVEFAMKGGLGSASRTLSDGLVVGAVVAVNSLGDVRDPGNGRVLAGRRDVAAVGRIDDAQSANTTLAVVGTNSHLTKSQATVVAAMAQDGFSRTIYPAHTSRDGDITFAVSTGDFRVDLDYLGAIAAEVVAEAIVRAVTRATSVGETPAHRDLCRIGNCKH